MGGATGATEQEKGGWRGRGGDWVAEAKGNRIQAKGKAYKDLYTRRD